MVPQAHIRYCLRQYLGDEYSSTAFFNKSTIKKFHSKKKRKKKKKKEKKRRKESLNKNIDQWWDKAKLVSISL
jgi:hypothetical protein